MEFNECVVVKIKSKNRDELFICIWSMQDMIQMKWAGGCGQDRFINVSDIHTCTIGSSYLVSVVVTLMHSELL
jgi:hypothetical protein